MRTQFKGNITKSGMKDRRGKYTGVNIQPADTVEAITEEYWRNWQMFGQTASTTMEEEVAIRQAEARGEARERARRDHELRELEEEKARRQDELRELEAYKAKYGPLQSLS